MRYRKLDADGDYTIGQGAAFLIDSPEAVAQAIGTRLKFWKGEWFIDTTDGTPWNEKVLGKRTAGRNYDAAIKHRILGAQGVSSIEGYSSAYDGTTRRISVVATVNTQYGQIMINEVL